jgi:Zn-dependent peptidase ImmA (M78 family)
MPMVTVMVSRLHRNRGAKRAREARAALKLAPDAPLPCLLTAVEERAGLPVVVGRLPEGIAGVCFRSDATTVLWVNGEQARVRQRFTLAHELGHAWCRHDGRLEVDTVATLSGRTTNPYEIEANAFAAEFLVPRAAMQELVDEDQTLDEIVTIAAHFGVSAIVVVFRLKTLGLISDACAERLQRLIEDGEHDGAAERLGLAPIDDRLAALGELPYLSPALQDSHLGAALRGDAAIEAPVAGAARRLLS